MADYSAVIMAHLVAINRLQSAKQIALDTKIPYHTVTKLLKILANSSILRSKAGIHGGYELARDAKEISLLDILQIIDGRIALTACNHQNKDCGLLANCRIRHQWGALNSYLEDILGSVSLTDFAFGNKLSLMQGGVYGK